jgi:hypothetical protein
MSNVFMYSHSAAIEVCKTPENTFFADLKRHFLANPNPKDSTTDSFYIGTGCCGGNDDQGSGNVTTEGPEPEDEGMSNWSIIVCL